MGLPVLIIGKSGSGKSASLRNFQPGEVGIVNVLGKPLPFRNKLSAVNTDDYKRVYSILKNAKTDCIVIDDAGYLMTNQFMMGHSSTGRGNDIFAFYNDIGDQFWHLVRFVVEGLPENRIVYFMMHEDKNDFGDVKPKTIGRMLDEKVCVEGMFTIVLRSALINGKHVFRTQTDGLDVCKTPIGMFDADEIDNDLKAVDTVIREYYYMNEEDNEMLKPRDYETTAAYGEFTPLELGGHICVIKSVEETKSSTGKDMLIVSLDTAPQDKQPGYYADQWRQDTREDKKWGCRVFQLVYDQDGHTNRGFKTFCTAVKRSNNGFQIQWGDGFAACFRGKLIGGVFGREEYLGNDGKPHWSTKCVQFRSVEAIQNGVEIPEDKPLKNAPASAKADIFETIEDVDGADLPF